MLVIRTRFGARSGSITDLGAPVSLSLSLSLSLGVTLAPVSPHVVLSSGRSGEACFMGLAITRTTLPLQSAE